MSARTSVTASAERHSAVATHEHYTIGFVTSKDGTTIGYRQLGHGPGVVMLHGAMESARSHMQLAGALADVFTVYLPDRRGRGMSGPTGNDYSTQREIEDLDALLTSTSAHNVFGVSSGGLIALQAALTLPAIQKAALYEPALFLDGKMPVEVLTRYDQEIADGKLAAALVTGMKGARMGPPIFNLMPNWLLERLTAMAMASEDKKAKSDDITMRMLAPTLHNDFTVVAEMSGNIERFRDVRAEMLLLGGSKSPAYLKAALSALEKAVPHVAHRIEFSGLDHGGSSDLSNTNRGGNPERVAQELRRFFA